MRIDEDTLISTVVAHNKWLNDEVGGVQADFSGLDLTSHKMRGYDLRQAIMRNTCLRNVDFANADLTRAILTDSDLTCAYFERANLTYTDLYNTKLTSCILSPSDLVKARSIIPVLGPDYPLILRRGTPHMVLAGCRYFTIEEARAHWSDANVRYGCHKLHIDTMRAKLEGAIAVATAQGW